MKMHFRQKYLLVFMFATLVLEASAQGYSYYENTQFDPFQRQTYRVGNKTLHSSLRSYYLNELNAVFNTDSVLYDGIRLPQKKMNIFRNFLYDDFLSWRSKEDNVYVAINPLFDFQVGTDCGKTTYTNSRGFYVNGNLGKNFWFYMDFSENQATYPEYFENYAEEHEVVPGQSNYRDETSAFDFQVANGYIAFNINKFIQIQAGKTKTFIGDGYRSLLLSDFACSYPMIRMFATFMNVKYMMMIAQLRTTDAQGVSNNGFRTKYSFTHYLDWNLWGRWTIGLFENVTMASWRKTGESRSIDWEYVNPFIIFRAGEFNAGSPDKMLVGMNTKIILARWLTIHGQLMFNEFRAKELFSDSKYWSNKYGFLAGMKIFNLFAARGLDFQAEYSQVRPFCYSQFDAMGTYTHSGQPLAHPLGANFREFVSILNYRHKRVSARAQFNIAQYGDDFPNDTISYGHNPDIASNYRNADYGVEMLQGVKTKLVYGDASMSFIINPRSMLNLTLGFRYRKCTSDYVDEESKHFYFALRWSLKNLYYDF